MEGIPPAWRNILAKDTQEALQSALAAYDKDISENVQLTPPRSQLFRALTFCSPENIRVVVIGQDPYPEGGSGLSFDPPTVDGKPKITPSLRNIAAALRTSKLLPEGDLPDFTEWARQGALMWNVALDTVLGKSEAHMSRWRPFTRLFLRDLVKFKEGSPLVFLLWGTKAQDAVKNLPEGPHYLKWTHPSPQADQRVSKEKKFQNCDHFTLVNEILSKANLTPINWALKSALKVNGEAKNKNKNVKYEVTGSESGSDDGSESGSDDGSDDGSDEGSDDDGSESTGNTEDESESGSEDGEEEPKVEPKEEPKEPPRDILFLFTDGSAPNNGQKGVRASWAYLLYKLRTTRGETTLDEIHRNGGIVDEAIFMGQKIPPSNNRGEMLAAVAGLNYIAGNNHLRDANVRVFTDSRYLITSATGVIARVQKGELFGRKTPILNPDLCGLLQMIIRALPRDPIFEHVRAAHDRPCPKTLYEATLWRGNKAADDLARAQFRDTTTHEMTPAARAAVNRAVRR